MRALRNTNDAVGWRFALITFVRRFFADSDGCRRCDLLTTRNRKLEADLLAAQKRSLTLAFQVREATEIAQQAYDAAAILEEQNDQLDRDLQRAVLALKAARAVDVLLTVPDRNSVDLAGAHAILIYRLDTVKDLMRSDEGSHA